MSKNNNTQKIVGLGLFTAIVIVLQLLGSVIKFGTFSVSLVLVPVVIGAALYGAGAGARLGFVFGVVVLLFGALTVTVGLLMNSAMFSFVEFNRITGYLFAGRGILLSLIAIVMGVSSHWRNKNRGA